MENHDQALYYLKKQLQLAWYLHSDLNELEAYDSMGIEYYYLGNINKACFYHNRMMAGVMEGDTDVKRWNMRLLEEEFKVKDVRNRMSYSSIFEEYRNAKKHGNPFVFLHENVRNRKK